MTDQPKDPFDRSRDTFSLNDGDPFILNEDASVVPVEKGRLYQPAAARDPFSPMGAGPGRFSSGPGKKRSRTGSAFAVVLLLTVGFGAATWVVSETADTTDDTTVQSDDWDEGLEDAFVDDDSLLYDYAPDLESWDAVPGDTFTFGRPGPVQVGNSLKSGFYVAQVDTDCSWSVSSHDDDEELDMYYAFDYVGDESPADKKTVLVALPRGYFFEVGGCREWTAIDPASVFEGPRSEVITEGMSYVGRDVAPGSYLVPAPTEDVDCSVFISRSLGFTGPGMEPDYYWPGPESLIFDVEQGDAVRLYDCPEASRVDPAELFAQDQGSSAFTDGKWLVGVDVRAGTYLGSREFSTTDEWCHLDVMSDSRARWEGGIKEWVNYGPEDDPSEVTLEPGNLIETEGCGEWTRQGP